MNLVPLGEERLGGGQCQRLHTYPNTSSRLCMDRAGG